MAPKRATPSLLAASLLTMVAIACAPPANESVDARSDRPVEVQQPGETSSKACRSCHERQYASWHRSYHRTMTRVGTPDAAAGPIDGVTPPGPYKLRFFVDDDRLMVELDEAYGPPRIRPVVMITGSHHLQVFWTSTADGNGVQMLKSEYSIVAGRWMPTDSVALVPPDDEPGAGHRERPQPFYWNRICATCHSTRPRANDGPGKLDTTVDEFGIACEACHGKGRDHVAKHRSPLTRYAAWMSDEEDESVINPARLSPRAASHVCGRCHQRGNLDMPTLEGFEPGGELPPMRTPSSSAQSSAIGDMRHDDEGFWPDGDVRGSGGEYTALSRSPCFAPAAATATDGGPDDPKAGAPGAGAPKAGDGAIHCMACHAMHPTDDDDRSLDAWADDQLKPGMRGDKACLQCHAMAADAIAQHTHHAVDSPGSRCQNCHMPFTTFGLMRAIRTHAIGSPNAAHDKVYGKPNACNLCHLDRPLAWTAQHLKAWYGTRPPFMNDRDRNVAAGVVWTLTGEARLRLLTAFAMGWQPARKASGTGWMAPYLANLLADPYDMVRFIAWQSAVALGLGGVDGYDVLAPAAKRATTTVAMRAAWNMVRKLADKPRTAPALLLKPDGSLHEPAFQALLGQRDHKPVQILE